jgi:hypothetical protein
MKNPFQGLKLIHSFLSLNYLYTFSYEKSLSGIETQEEEIDFGYPSRSRLSVMKNPFQGLKLNGLQREGIVSDKLSVMKNPFQGLKLELSCFGSGNGGSLFGLSVMKNPFQGLKP